MTIQHDVTRSSTADVAAELRRREALVFLSHVKPDGDTLGSALALGMALRALGKRVHYYQQDPIPRNLRWMPDAERISNAIPEDLPEDALWVFCDMSDPARAGDAVPPLERRNVLDIDHHLANPGFGAYNYVLETECSTGACVIPLLRELGAEITPGIATNLLTAIMTDTGGFMHSNTDGHVLRLSAEMIDAGADKDAITERIFANKRFAAIKIVGAATVAARLEEQGRFCWSVVDDAMLAACGADGEDTEEIVQHLRSVEGVDVAALFKDYDGDLRVSLRGNGRVNVQRAAGRLGGGGHHRASGLTFHGPVADAVEAVREALRAEGL